MSTGYGATRIPKRFWGQKLTDYEASKGTTQAVQDVEDYIADLEHHKEKGTGLTLTGPPGAGKTMLMAIIGMAAHDAGYKVMYMPIAVYYQHLKNMMRWEDWATAEQDWEKLRQLTLDVRNKIDFLLLDDVGKEYRSDPVNPHAWAQSEFDFLLRRRFDLALPTIMTSNAPVHMWAVEYSEAMESFIHEAAPEVEVVSQDYRKR